MAASICVCDLYLHSVSLTGSFVTEAHACLPQGSTPDWSSISLVLQLSGSISSAPSVTISVTDSLPMSESIALRLQREVSVAINKGKSLLIHLPSSTTNRHDQLSASVLLVGCGTGQETAAYIAHGLISLEQLSSNLQAAPDGIALQQVAAPLITLSGATIGTVVLSFKLSRVPDALRPYFAQQLATQDASVRTQVSSPTPAIPLSESALAAISAASLRLPANPAGAKASGRVPRQLQKATARGAQELRGHDVEMPAPICFGNIGAIRMPALPPQPPAAIAASVMHMHAAEASGFDQQQQQAAQVPPASAIPGSRHQLSQQDATPRDNAGAQSAADMRHLDSLLSELIQLRDFAQSSSHGHLPQPTVASPKLAGTSAQSLHDTAGSAPYAKLPTRVSASMAALQASLAATGLADDAAERVVRTLSLAHEHRPADDAGNTNPLASSVALAKSSALDNLQHQLAKEIQSNALAQLLPQTFKSLQSSAVEAFAAGALSKHSHAQGLSSHDGSSASPMAGSPLRGGAGRDGLGARSRVGATGKPGLGSPARSINGQENKGLNQSFRSASELLERGTASHRHANVRIAAAGLAGSPYAVPVGTPARGSQLRKRTGQHRADSTFDGASVSESQTETPKEAHEAVSGVRMTTALRARLAALEEEKRAARYAAVEDGLDWKNQYRRGSTASSHGSGTIASHAVNASMRSGGGGGAGGSSSSSRRGSGQVPHAESQADRDARRSGGYRPPVAPNEVPSLLASPSKHALQVMPSARANMNAKETGAAASKTATVPLPSLQNRHQSTRAAPEGTIRSSIELPNTSTLLPGDVSAAADLVNSLAAPEPADDGIVTSGTAGHQLVGNATAAGITIGDGGSMLQITAFDAASRTNDNATAAQSPVKQSISLASGAHASTAIGEDDVVQESVLSGASAPDNSVGRVDDSNVNATVMQLSSSTSSPQKAAQGGTSNVDLSVLSSVRSAPSDGTGTSNLVGRNLDAHLGDTLGSDGIAEAVHTSGLNNGNDLIESSLSPDDASATHISDQLASPVTPVGTSSAFGSTGGSLGGISASNASANASLAAAEPMSAPAPAASKSPDATAKVLAKIGSLKTLAQKTAERFKAKAKEKSSKRAAASPGDVSGSYSDISSEDLSSDVSGGYAKGNGRATGSASDRNGGDSRLQLSEDSSEIIVEESGESGADASVEEDSGGIDESSEHDDIGYGARDYGASASFARSASFSSSAAARQVYGGAAALQPAIIDRNGMFATRGDSFRAGSTSGAGSVNNSLNRGSSFNTSNSSMNATDRALAAAAAASASMMNISGVPVQFRAAPSLHASQLYGHRVVDEDEDLPVHGASGYGYAQGGHDLDCYGDVEVDDEDYGHAAVSASRRGYGVQQQQQHSHGYVEDAEEYEGVDDGGDAYADAGDGMGGGAEHEIDEDALYANGGMSDLDESDNAF